MGLRREARELAMQMLYAMDTNPFSTLRTTMGTFRHEFSNVPTRVREFAEALAQGVDEHRPELDEAIRARSKNWSIPRMPKVDLNIMRIAAYELMFLPDIPKNVTINEAIEIARKFGDKESPSFVNGILDEIEACTKQEIISEEP